MTPVGLGIDLVEVERVARILSAKGDRAWHRLLTDEEQTYCLERSSPERHVAARVAAKEAAYKALSQGGETGYIGWRDVEVGREVNGSPALRFYGRASETARRLKVSSSLLSLTHTATHAAAVVVLFR